MDDDDEEEGGEEEEHEDEIKNPYDDGEQIIEYDPDILVAALIRFMKDKDQRKKELGKDSLEINFFFFFF